MCGFHFLRSFHHHQALNARMLAKDRGLARMLEELKRAQSRTRELGVLHASTVRHR